MRKRYLFMTAAALSCMVSFGSMATEADSETFSVTPAVDVVDEATTDMAAESSVENQTSFALEQETATLQNETAGNKDIPVEDVIKDYEKGLMESGQETEQNHLETETFVTETETNQETEAETEASQTETEGDANTEAEAETETETETETEAETETEQDYIEVPSDGITEAMQEIYSYLRYEMGFNHAAACGVVANMKYESNYDPTAVGDGGSSYGLCQWHNGRYSALMSYCGNNGLDGNSISGQMAFLSNELSNGFQNITEHLKSVPDNAQGAYDAAYYWCKYYEVPANVESCATERANFAQNELYGKSFTYKKTMKKAVADIRHEILEDAFVEAKDEEVYQSISQMVHHK